MRTLADRSSLDPPGFARRWRRLLSHAPFDGRLVDCYAFGEPYLSLNALLLTPHEAGELRRLTDVFAGVFAKAAAAIAQDTALLQSMGFPWPAVELLQDEAGARGAARRPQSVLLGRFDFGLDLDGRWQLFEFNSDTPSGIREAEAAEGSIHRSIGTGTKRLTRSFSSRLAAAAERRIRTHEQRTSRTVRTVAVVTQASYQEDIAQSAFFCDLLESHWSRHAKTESSALRPQSWSRTAVLGDIGNLWVEDGDLFLLGERVDALYRLYPYERLYGHPLFAPICEAVADGRLCLLNGLRGFLPQSKAVMSWIWQERDSLRFTPQQRRAIADHLPPTYRLDEAPAGLPRAAWVVKEFWGREGEEVYLGSEMNDDDWERCRRWGTFVAQQRVATQEVTGLRLEGDQVVRHPALASVGAFALNGRFAGCYSRLGGAIINARAKYVATLVDGS